MLKPISNEKPKKSSKGKSKISITLEELEDFVPDSVIELLEQIDTNSDGVVCYETKMQRAERSVFRKRKPIRVSAWAEKHRIVSNSSRMGKWKNTTANYLTGIMDSAGFNCVQEISIMKTPQTGGSECVNNIVGYFADRSPSPMLYVFPDEGTAKENMRDRVIPMFKDSPQLKSLMTQNKDDASTLRVALKTCIMYVAWSGSVARLASKPIRILVLDEIDKYQENKKEASAEALAIHRIKTYKPNHKIFRISSPSDSASPISEAFDVAQVRFEFVCKCLHCGADIVMKFENIKWDGGIKADPEDIMSKHLAFYECSTCGSAWSDAERDISVRRGFWRDMETHMELYAYLEVYKPISVAFHVPSWISPFVSLSDVARDFIKYQQAKEAGKAKWRKMMQDFVNGHLAEKYIDWRSDRSEDGIKALCDERPRGVVPSVGEDGVPKVAAIFGGIDTQKGDYRYVIRAYGYGEEQESWLLACGVVPTEKSLVDAVLDRKFQDAEGNEYRVDFSFMDSGGNKTNDVYKFCKKHSSKVAPIKGMRTQGMPISYTKLEYYAGTEIKIRGGLHLAKLDTTYFKDVLAEKLNVVSGDLGAFNLHRDDPSLEQYYKEMTVEFFDPEIGAWVCPKGKENHFWDCEVYALACAERFDITSMLPYDEDDEDDEEFIDHGDNDSEDNFYEEDGVY